MKILPVTNFNYHRQTKNINFGVSNSHNETTEILRNEIKFNDNMIKSTQEKIIYLKEKLETTNDNYTKIAISTQIKSLQSNINDIINTNINLSKKLQHIESSRNNENIKNSNDDTPKATGWYGDYDISKSDELAEYIRDVMNPPGSFL